MSTSWTIAAFKDGCNGSKTPSLGWRLYGKNSRPSSLKNWKYPDNPTRDRAPPSKNSLPLSLTCMHAKIDEEAQKGKIIVKKHTKEFNHCVYVKLHENKWMRGNHSIRVLLLIPFPVHFIDYVAKDKVTWKSFDDFSAFFWLLSSQHPKVSH